MSTLTDRLRGIVESAVPRVAPDLRGPTCRKPAAGASTADEASLRRAAEVLGGSLAATAAGATIVVDRGYAAGDRHGRATVGEITGILRDGEEALALLTAAWPPPRRISDSVAGTAFRPPVSSPSTAAAGPEDRVTRDGPPRSVPVPSPAAASCPASGLCFLDLETTGLTGGAGTQAFLVGCAVIAGDGLAVRQFVLPGYEHERSLLAAVASWAAAYGALVTFNGKSFDVPLIETRYLFHRVPFPMDGMAHVDMLHPARRFWRARGAWQGSEEASCSLASLERLLAGLHRVGDVPGFEIPSRYFQFVRDGDARPLAAVLAHNRLDLLSLALVMARVLALIDRGPAAASSAYECLGLARVYDRAGRPDEADAAYEQAIARLERTGHDPEATADALRRLAHCRRRAGRHRDAASAWQRLAELPRCPAALRREAHEALAIFHEHRTRDLETAHACVRALLRVDAGDTGRRRGDAQHRLDRLERKLAQRDASLWE